MSTTLLILKTLRDKPLTRRALSKEIGLSHSATGHQLRRLMNEGFIVDYTGEKGETGPAPLLYTVSRRWRDDVDPRSSDPLPFPQPKDQS